MDRRAFLALILAGAAETGPATRVASPPSAAPPAPLPPAADPGRSRAWLAVSSDRSIKAGLPAALVRRDPAGLTADPAVLALDGRQPEFSKPVGDYVRGVISDDRVALGRRKLAD